MKKFKDVKELKDFYNTFENKCLGNIYDYIVKQYPNISISMNKGVVGQVLEAVIGNPPNSDPHPDVKNINVELKVLPLRKINNKIQPKERSKIKSINYNKIVNEVWISSDVRNKMEKILFLLYEHPTGKTYKDWKEFVFKGTLLYEVEKEKENIVQEDWEGIQYKVKTGIANQLSEGDSKILGACTSGTGKLIPYGNNKKAKQRSYSLKNSYLKFYYNQNKNKNQYSSLNIEGEISPEEFVLEKLNKQLNGKHLKNLVNKYDVKFSNTAKSGFRLLINRILHIDDKKKILELEEKGIVIKTIPVDENNKPWEAMSFPKFSLVDFITEEWEGDSGNSNEAVFKNIISQGFIFIPIIKEKETGGKSSRFKNWSTWKIGKAVYWKASQKELDIIKGEWEKAKNIIVKSEIKVNNVKHGKKTRQENNLIKSSQTDIIHIRPHARDSKDIDKPYALYTNGKIKICWQSFWLNKSFTEKILKNL